MCGLALVRPRPRSLGFHDALQQLPATARLDGARLKRKIGVALGVTSAYADAVVCIGRAHGPSLVGQTRRSSPDRGRDRAHRVAAEATTRRAHEVLSRAVRAKLRGGET